eukprot:Selendium_serpulae@DN5884_c0_g1_i1.p1
MRAPSHHKHVHSHSFWQPLSHRQELACPGHVIETVLDFYGATGPFRELTGKHGLEHRASRHQERGMQSHLPVANSNDNVPEIGLEIQRLPENQLTSPRIGAAGLIDTFHCEPRKALESNRLTEAESGES